MMAPMYALFSNRPVRFSDAPAQDVPICAVLQGGLLPQMEASVY
jgi:hypothetical protein